LDNMDKYKKLFFSECNEHFEVISDLLLQMEKGAVLPDIIRSLLCEAHSLKGMCSTMGYTEVSDVFHELESFLTDINTKGAQCGRGECDILFYGFDVTQKYIEELESGGDGSSCRDRLEEFIKQLEPNKDAWNKSEAEDVPLIGIEPEDVWDVAFSLGRNTTLPAARGFVIVSEMASLGQVLSSKPSLEELKNGAESFAFSVRFSSTASRDKILKSISSHSEVMGLSLKKIAKRKTAQKDTEKKPRAVRKKAVSPKTTKASSVAEKKAKNAEPAKQAAHELTPPQVDEISKFKKPANVRVETAVLNKLLSLVEELIIDEGKLRGQCGSFANRDITRGFAKVDNHILSIYSIISDMRMFPFDYVSSRFPRAIRDLAAKHNKKVKFVMSGQEIKLDRSILEELADPLLHIFRNAIDHGIEEKEVRLKKGKPAEGTIEVSVVREKETVCVTISDDGNGVDLTKVRKKAIKLGIYTERDINRLSEAEQLNIVTTPGFSTSDEVSMVSGRGVGLDVAKSKISNFGGKMFILSKPGKETRIKIELPMTVAVVRALLVRIGEQPLAVPISRIYSTAEVKKEHVYYTSTQRMFDWGGELLPIVEMSKILHVENSGTDAENSPEGRGTENGIKEVKDYYSVVVMGIRDNRVGMIVDSVVGQYEIVVKPLRKPLDKISFFSGATVLGDGTPVLILDVGNLLDSKKSYFAEGTEE